MYSYDDFSDYEEENSFDIFSRSEINSHEYINEFNQLNRVIVDQDLSHKHVFCEENPFSDTSISVSNSSSSLTPDSLSPYCEDVSPARSSAFAPFTVSKDEDKNDEGHRIPNISNHSRNSLPSRPLGSLSNLQNSAFSSALLNYCLQTSVQDSDTPSKTDSSGNSRYSRALQLLRNKEVERRDDTVTHSHSFPNEECLEGVRDFESVNSTCSESEDLYDYLSSALLQECTDNRFLTPEDFTVNRSDEGDVPVDLRLSRDVSVDLITPHDLPQGYVLPKVHCPDFSSSSVAKEETGALAGEHGITNRCNLQEHQSPFKRFKEQIKVFHMRVKVANYSYTLSLGSQQHQKPSRLEIYLEKIEKSSSHSEVIGNVSLLSDVLTREQAFANSFLSHYFVYVQSVIDLEFSLLGVNEFLAYFHPCVEIAMKGQLETKLMEEMKQIGLLPLVFNSLRKMISQETKFNHNTVSDMLVCSQKCSVKAHIVRMQPTQSQELFQETFSDAGNLTDLYLIYIWRILKLYEIEERDGNEPSVVCLSEAMEQSGKFISVVPVKKVNERENKNQFLQMKDGSRMEGELSQLSSDLSYEWVDFRIGHIYENGVVFLTNMVDWLHQLKEISSSIDKLEVKRGVKFVPALGSTFGLRLEDGLRIMNKVEEVSYMRVRVVRLAGPVARVYGIDTGNVLISEVARFILLPAPLLNIPPCGRLAHLPIVPAPRAQIVSPTLNLLVALTRRVALAKHLSSMEVGPMWVWLQVPELTHPVLVLLMAMLKAVGDTPLMNDICTLVTDYLLLVTYKHAENRLCTNKALSILISAMETSPKIRLLLAREGSFVTLCDLGLKVGDQQIWNVLRLLLGGKNAMDSWLSMSNKISQIRNRRNFRPWQLDHMSALDKPNGDDPSLAVIRIASMTTVDRNWDLEVRSTIRSRQLVPYCDPSGWCWKKQEVLTAVIGDLHYGHKLVVQNDETHHIILDKSVPNIRMNTLLQIILGMLNTGLGGKIYIGLNNLGVVQGVRMTRDQRDCFMLGFSKLVTSEIFPLVFPCDSLIQFSPVVRSGFSSTSGQSGASGSISLSTETALFVVIITVRPQPSVLYRYRCDPESVLMREGGVTSNIRGHRLSQLSSVLTSQCQHLQQKVSLEKQSLLKLIFSNEAKET